MKEMYYKKKKVFVKKALEDMEKSIVSYSPNGEKAFLVEDKELKIKK